jgi:short-subunit dehydrogenase
MVFQKLLQERPERVFYLAGGGPHGNYAAKRWRDHQWALELNLLAPMRLAHQLLNRFPQNSPQLILCGSAIAESNGDVNAASYAAAKHGLKGLFSSLYLENPEWDLRLFSPGYMDTELLPKSAPVRYKKVWDPSEMARDLLEWAKIPGERHKVYPLYAE